MIIRPALAADPLKVGFIYVGAVADVGWTHQHDLARKALEADLGSAIKTTYVERVNEDLESEPIISELARSGHDLIYTTSFGYMNPTLKVAKRFPKVKFEHATGYKRAENVATYNIRFYEGRYIQGVIAGKMSRSGIVGYIGSMPIPEVIMGMNAFILGMRTINPAAKARAVFIDSWYDPGKEADTAKALIDQGADMMAQHTASTAPLQIAEQHGIKGFGQATDMIKAAPNAQLTSSINNWEPYYLTRTKAVIDGTWKSRNTWGGLSTGMLKMAAYTNMPGDVASLARQTEAAISGGKLVIFKGPIKDQSGAVKVPDGTALDDGAIAAMNWLAEGIEGLLPK